MPYDYIHHQNGRMLRNRSKKTNCSINPKTIRTNNIFTKNRTMKNNYHSHNIPRNLQVINISISRRAHQLFHRQTRISNVQEKPPHKNLVDLDTNKMSIIGWIPVLLWILFKRHNHQDHLTNNKYLHILFISLFMRTHSNLLPTLHNTPKNN